MHLNELCDIYNLLEIFFENHVWILLHKIYKYNKGPLLSWWIQMSRMEYESNCLDDDNENVTTTTSPVVWQHYACNEYTTTVV